MSNEAPNHTSQTGAQCSACAGEIDGPETASREEASPATRQRLSLDSWAVLLALATAALVKLHILNTVKW